VVILSDSFLYNTLNFLKLTRRIRTGKRTTKTPRTRARMANPRCSRSDVVKHSLLPS